MCIVREQLERGELTSRGELEGRAAGLAMGWVRDRREHREQMGRSSDRSTSQRDRHAVVAAQCGREEMQFVTAILEITQLGMARCWPVHARHERIAPTLQRHSVPVARGDQQRRPTPCRELRRSRDEAVYCGRDALRRRLPPVLERVFGGGSPGTCSG